MEILATIATQQTTLQKKTIQFENGTIYEGEVNESGKPHGRGKINYK